MLASTKTPREEQHALLEIRGRTCRLLFLLLEEREGGEGVGRKKKVGRKERRERQKEGG
jgi:hypothetical protein